MEHMIYGIYVCICLVRPDYSYISLIEPSISQWCPCSLTIWHWKAIFFQIFVFYSIFYISAVLSRGWAKASACCFQVCLSCAVLCQVISFQYSSKSSLHLFAGLPHNLFLPYGFQVVMRFFYYCKLKFTFLLHLTHTCRKTHPRGPACI